MYRPKPNRKAVWETYCGLQYVALCWCCRQEQITPFRFECGHVSSHASGGGVDTVNLRPICASCNRRMGTHDMEEYMKQCFASNMFAISPAQQLAKSAVSSPAYSGCEAPRATETKTPTSVMSTPPRSGVRPPPSPDDAKRSSNKLEESPTNPATIGVVGRHALTMQDIKHLASVLQANAGPLYVCSLVSTTKIVGFVAKPNRQISAVGLKPKTHTHRRGTIAVVSERPKRLGR
jgi:hypothetical protein